MNETVVDELVRVATDDVEAALRLLDGDRPMHGVAAYHAEQAAEKAIKAALAQAGVVAPRTHDVAALVALLPVGHPLETTAAQTVVTKPWATGFRYSITTPPSLAEITDALTATAGVIEGVESAMTPPSSAFTTSLRKAPSGVAASKRTALLAVDLKLLRAARSAPVSGEGAEVAALRAIVESAVSQPELDTTTSQSKPTGRRVQGWEAVRHLEDRLSGQSPTAWTNMHVNTARLEELVLAEPALSRGFAALSTFDQQRSRATALGPAPIDNGMGGP